MRATPEGVRGGVPWRLLLQRCSMFPRKGGETWGVISLEKRLPDIAVFKLKDEVQGKETACLLFL